VKIPDDLPEDAKQLLVAILTATRDRSCTYNDILLAIAAAAAHFVFEAPPHLAGRERLQWFAAKVHESLKGRGWRCWPRLSSMNRTEFNQIGARPSNESFRSDLTVIAADLGIDERSP